MENMENLKDRIEEFVNDLFAEFQQANGIEYGDIPWDASFELDELEENLAECIKNVMAWQAQMNRVEE